MRFLDREPRQDRVAILANAELGRACPHECVMREASQTSDLGHLVDIHSNIDLLERDQVQVTHPLQGTGHAREIQLHVAPNAALDVVARDPQPRAR